MKIVKAKYEGYLWMSDAQSPRVIDNEEFDLELPDEANPFIVEGQLFNREEGISISIKYVDGKYLCKEYSVGNQTACDTKVFYANRMEGKKLRFFQYWRDAANDLCEGMPVLQPAELVFVGFE